MLYLFCSNCKPIFTFCSILLIFLHKLPCDLKIRAQNKFQILASGLIVAMNTFHSFMAFLRMKAKRSDGPRFKAAKIDWLVSFNAIAIAAIINPPQGRFDFLQQFAFTVAGSKVKSGIAFNLRAIHLVWLMQIFLR